MKNNQEFKKPLIFDIDISPFQQYPMTYKGVVSQQKDTLPKENCMNKKFIAFTLVLLIAVGGLFAAVPGFDSSADVTAVLKGIIGSYFDHGFTNPKTGLDYQSGFTIGENDDLDAFETVTPLTYKYRTNAGLGVKITMTVDKFTSGENIVRIAKVNIDGTDKTSANGVYEIGGFSGSGKKTGSTVIKITAATADGGKDHMNVEIGRASCRERV